MWYIFPACSRYKTYVQQLEIDTVFALQLKHHSYLVVDGNGLIPNVNIFF
jgi:hypothetical protein